MNAYGLDSDQSNTWSVCDDRSTILRRAQTTPQTVAAETSATGLRDARIPHRALQALRQSRLQMCRRPRTWAKVLPVGQLPWQNAADGLRATRRPRRDQPAPGQLSPGSRDPGGDLRDQSRTVAPPRVALRSRGEPDANIARRSHRHPSCRNASRQHAHRLDGTGAHTRLNRGDCR